MREKVMRVLRKRHREKCNSLLPAWLCVTPNERPQRRGPHQNISVGRIHEVSHHWGARPSLFHPQCGIIQVCLRSHVA